jgi:probable addiction module antidote protein
MSQVAKSAGVTTEGLYKTLGENGNPEFATVLRIIAAMRNRLAAGAAPPRPGKKTAESR